jgi:hypothetical protein
MGAITFMERRRFLISTLAALAASSLNGSGAADFDARKFLATLQSARVNSGFAGAGAGHVTTEARTKSLPFRYADGYAHAEVPRVVGNQAIVFE